MNTRRFPTIILLSALLALLAACSTSPSAGPKPIAVAEFPRVTPIAVYPGRPGDIAQAGIQLLVDDPGQAAASAISLAARYGGYLAGQSPWQAGYYPVIVLDLVIPQRSFEDFYREALKLGTPTGEVSWTLSEPAGPVDPTRYLLVNLTLRARSTAPLLPGDTGWDPGRTLRQAWGVFVSIFGFLVDILIWIVVVAGPFIAIAAAIYFALRRIRRPLN